LKDILQPFSELVAKKDHQSVLVGTGTLTEAFLAELREREILDHVQIMEIGKAGTTSL